jgi:hypothetical protein
VGTGPGEGDGRKEGGGEEEPRRRGGAANSSRKAGQAIGPVVPLDVLVAPDPQKRNGPGGPEGGQEGASLEDKRGILGGLGRTGDRL